VQESDEKVTVSPTHAGCDWDHIDWDQAVQYVRRLRQEIFRATKEGDLKKVRTLQRIMLRSYDNRVLAVRRVTQINRGKNTPGVDGIVLKTPEAHGKLVDRLGSFEPWKPLPARRVYIPKADGRQRPLGIPVILDRALQAIVKNALEPFWEAKFEDSSYGFRPGRGCHDAIERIFNLGSAKGHRRWVLDADIKGAFDNIDHDKLLEVIGNFPARELIRQWLKAGYMEGGVFHDTDSGTPQGGVISPLLANIALHGMEAALGIKYRLIKNRSYGSELRPECVGLVRYADDFVVFCHTQAEAEEIRGKLTAWLGERGLVFSPDKTRIANLDDGFDFLGFNVRQYRVTNSSTGYRLLIRPSKKSLKKHALKLKEIFRTYRAYPASWICSLANPVIRGWANYFRVGVSSRAFEKLDTYLFRLQKRWVVRQHPSKSWAWRRREYWGRERAGRATVWVFKGYQTYMLRHAWTSIKRHILVRRFASWDDPDLERYWAARKARETELSLTRTQQRLARTQEWVCPFCRDHLLNGEELYEYRVVPGTTGGEYTRGIVRLAHESCRSAEDTSPRRTEP
jgi:RNA-directed DNA polymerase